MSDDDQAPAAESPASITEVQLTLAKAQLAMAEALRALSSGASLPVVRTAPAAGEDDAFTHIGVLGYDKTRGPNGLFFAEYGVDKPEWLNDLAVQGKRIRLEFTLSQLSLLREDADDLALQFNALGTFLRNRAGALVPMRTTCRPTSPPPKTPATPSGPTPPPEPSTPPNPPPPTD